MEETASFEDFLASKSPHFFLIKISILILVYSSLKCKHFPSYQKPSKFQKEDFSMLSTKGWIH